MVSAVDAVYRRVHCVIVRLRADGALPPFRLSTQIVAPAMSGHSGPMVVIALALYYTRFTAIADRSEILGTPTGRRAGAAA